MPSTYTLNNGIELIATGEQSGTWGDTTNTNLELLDTALDGQVTVTLASAGSSGSPNSLPISDGTASNGRNRMVIFDDSSDLGATAYVQLTPNDAEKIIYVRNSLSGSRSILFFQGTYSASNDYEVPAGTTAILFFDGAGSGAVAANVFNNAHFDALNVVGQAKITTGSGNTYPTASTSADELIVSNLTASAPSGITIFSDNASSGNIFFGDEDDADNGRIVYDHSTATGNPSMAFSTSATEAMRIDSSQRVLIGTSSSINGYYLQVAENSGYAGISALRYTNDAFGAYLNLGKSRTTTIGGNTIVQDDDVVGYITFSPNDGTDLVSISSQIQGEIDGTPGANDVPGRLVFKTTADGAASSTERMRIDNAGRVGIGTTLTGSPAKLHIAGSDSGDFKALTIRNGDGTTDSAAVLGFEASAGTIGDDASLAGQIKGIRLGGGTIGALSFHTTTAGVPTEAMRIDSAQRVLIGATSNTAIGGHNAATQIVGSGSYHEATLTIQGNENNSNGAYLGFSSSRGTTAGSTTIVQDDDTLGQVYFAGADGTDLGTVAAAITAQVDGTPGSNDMPGRLMFATTTDGSASLTERMRITSSGNVGIASGGDVGLDSTDIALQVGSGSSSNPTIQIRSSSSGTGQLWFGDNSGSDAGRYDGFIQYNQTDRFMYFGTAQSNALRIDSDQRTIIGGYSHTPIINASVQASVVGGSADSGSGGFGIARFGGPPVVALASSPNTTVGSFTLTSDGTAMGYIYYGADDGTDIRTAGAYIAGIVDGTPGSNDMPGRLVFATTADGAATPTERMRITNGGHVLVGTTNTAPWSDNSDDYGIAIRAGGYIGISSNNSSTLDLNRQNGNGNHINLYRDGTKRANIGVIDTDILFLASSDGLGLKFNSDSSRIDMCSASGTSLDAAADIGGSSSRIKDIYLSGGVRFAGTSANYLNDYEEGTWTPSLEGSTGAVTTSGGTFYGYYTKVGQLVTAKFEIQNTTISGGSGYIQIPLSDLPYAPNFLNSGREIAGGACETYQVTWPHDGTIGTRLEPTEGIQFQVSRNAGQWSIVTTANAAGSNRYFSGFVTYRTSS